MSWLIWFDPRKRPLADKLAEGTARYRRKFGKEPVEVLVNPAEAGEVVGVRACATVGKWQYWIGEEGDE